MIVSRKGKELLVFTQNDHAHFAAELLSLWCVGGLPEHPRRRELLFAVREHDNGWRETDSAPFCDRASGRPHDFLSLPDAERREIWRRGTTRHAAREPYATLLILRHAQRLHRRHRDDPEWNVVFAEWGALAGELVETSGVDEARWKIDDRWVELADLLSLTVCQGWTVRVERHGTEARFADADGGPGAGVLRLEPFPLAGVTAFEIPCRRIPDRAYDGDADLAAELAAARWHSFAVRVVRRE